MKNLITIIIILFTSVSLFSRRTPVTCIIDCAINYSDHNSQDFLCCVESCYESRSNKVLGFNRIINPNSLLFKGIVVEQNSIYPNPVMSNAKLNYASVQDTDLQVSIIDINGIEQMNQTFPISEGEGTVDLNMNQLSIGVYFVRVSNGKYSETIKVNKS